MLKNRYIKWLLIIVFITSSVYGLGRLYYKITDGFTVSNITSNYKYNEKYQTHPLTNDEKVLVDSVLEQKFKYLGKGCQSYVFLSQDGKYVLKFVKYQRFRPQEWLDYLTFIPGMEGYRQKKIEKKQKKLDMLFTSWKLAFDELKPETGLVYVHLNKSKDLNKTILIYDKMNVEHALNADDMEFLIQQKANMLCPTINQVVKEQGIDEGKNLIDRLITTITQENQRQLADNDHALMQNTGVLAGAPVHIDVGQFMMSPDAMEPKVYKQNLFNKMYKFHIWLGRHHPQLAQYLNMRLHEIIGNEMDQMEPQVKNRHVWSEEQE